jgi:hypothetical protein
MSGLSKPIDDYPDGVKLVVGERQTHNEIHTDVATIPHASYVKLAAGILRGCNNPVGLI